MSETVKCCREWAVYADNAGTAILVHADNEAGEERVRLLRGDHYHCSKCGARFTLTETGEVQVGKPYAELEDAAEFAETEATHLQAQVDALIDYLVTEPVQIPPGYEGALVWEPAALWVEWAATEADYAIRQQEEGEPDGK